MLSHSLVESYQRSLHFSAAPCCSDLLEPQSPIMVLNFILPKSGPVLLYPTLLVPLYGTRLIPISRLILLYPTLLAPLHPTFLAPLYPTQQVPVYPICLVLLSHLAGSLQVISYP